MRGKWWFFHGILMGSIPLVSTWWLMEGRLFSSVIFRARNLRLEWISNCRAWLSVNTWLAGKSYVNGSFNGKIIQKWSTFQPAMLAAWKSWRVDGGFPAMRRPPDHPFLDFSLSIFRLGLYPFMEIPIGGFHEERWQEFGGPTMKDEQLEDLISNHDEFLGLIC